MQDGDMPSTPLPNPLKQGRQPPPSLLLVHWLRLVLQSMQLVSVLWLTRSMLL
jgi:hypothetical protein